MLSKIVMWDYFIPRFFMLILQRRWRSKITRAKLVKIALHFWFDSLGSPPSFFLPSSSLLFSSPLSPFLSISLLGASPRSKIPPAIDIKNLPKMAGCLQLWLSSQVATRQISNKKWPRGDQRAPKVVATLRNQYLICVEWSPRMIKTKVCTSLP